jgi:hypothetical protein
MNLSASAAPVAAQVLTIEYLDADGQLQRTEQLRGTAFTVRVQAGDALPASQYDTPGESKFAPWAKVLGLGLILALLLGWSEWVSHNPDQAGKNYVATGLGFVAALAAWAAVWAMLGKVFARRADYARHLGAVLGLGLVFDLTTRACHFLAYSASWFVLGRIDNLIFIVLLCILVWAHLKLIVSPTRAKTTSVVMLVLGGLLLAMALWSNDRKRDTVLDALYSPHLLSPAFQLRPSGRSEDFFGQAVGLETVLKAKAAKAEPGEDVPGGDDLD